MLTWWAAQHLPAPPHGPRQVAPYDRAVRALRLSSQQAQALGFTGVDADLLTPGWRHLITCLRASRDRHAAVDPAPQAVQSRGVLLAQRPGRDARQQRRAANSREEPQHGAAPPGRGGRPAQAAAHRRRLSLRRTVLLCRAQAAGQVRPGIELVNVLRLGMLLANEQSPSPDGAGPMFDILIAGIRTGTRVMNCQVSTGVDPLGPPMALGPSRRWSRYGS
jgi:hypothetical protein